MRKEHAELTSGTVHRFSEWADSTVPSVAAGVYTVWADKEYIYAGMSGRGASKEDLVVDVAENGRVSKAKGLFTRLRSHASGRRSGDQFCIYVCDRFVVPKLTKDEQHKIDAGKLLLDELTSQFIHAHLTYRYTVTEDGKAAQSLETLARTGALGVGRPHLNPLGPSVKQLADWCGVSPQKLTAWKKRTFPSREGRSARTGIPDEQVDAALVEFGGTRPW